MDSALGATVRVGRKFRVERVNHINITFPDWVIVENIIPRNVIINRGAAEVDNHIRGMIFSTFTQPGNVIFILLY